MYNYNDSYYYIYIRLMCAYCVGIFTYLRVRRFKTPLSLL